MSYEFRVEYVAIEAIESVDERIINAVDRQSDFSGCGLLEGANRDHGWYCKTRTEADRLQRDIDDHYEGWPPLTTHIRERSL